MNSIYEERYKKVISHMERENIDLLIATAPENIYYLTGYMSVGQQISRGTQVYAATHPDLGTALVVGRAELPSAIEAGVNPEKIFCYGNFNFSFADGWIDSSKMTARLNATEVTPANALLCACRSLQNIDSIAIDEGGVNPLQWEDMVAVIKSKKLVSGGALFKTIRKIKDKGEITQLRRSAEIAEEGIQEVCRQFREGMTEIDLTAIYESYLISQRANPFFTVITSGERTSYVDTISTARKIREGDIVRFDLGCSYKGYKSDIARTATVGVPTEKTRLYYTAILEGLNAGIKAIKPGITSEAIYNVTLNRVREAGIPEYKRHHCGHAIGLDVSEPPGISPGVTVTLEEGMVFCLETPYYELGWGGVQVEDTLVVTSNGCQLFTQSPDKLLSLGGK